MKSMWTKLSTSGKAGVLLGLAGLAGMLIFAARRDLAARAPSETRGDPEVWDKVTRMPGGATAYLIAGRKPLSKTG